MYIVFIYSAEHSGIHKFGGVFSTIEKAKEVVDEWNKLYENGVYFANFFNITDMMDKTFILGVSGD